MDLRAQIIETTYFFKGVSGWEKDQLCKGCLDRVNDRPPLVLPAGAFEVFSLADPPTRG